MRAIVLLAVLLLSACAGSRQGPSYVTGSDSTECAPFARAETGIDLHGDAADWWPEARGHYGRSQVPERNAVLVFKRGPSLPYGHVSVVRKLDGPRRILVDQANWVHHKISRGEPVIDVSPNNDWTQVRVWWSPAGTMGATVYSTYGFVLPHR